jgi:hypothetical protein
MNPPSTNPKPQGSLLGPNPKGFHRASLGHQPRATQVEIERPEAPKHALWGLPFSIFFISIFWEFYLHRKFAKPFWFFGWVFSFFFFWQSLKSRPENQNQNISSLENACAGVIYFLFILFIFFVVFSLSLPSAGRELGTLPLIALGSRFVPSVAIFFEIFILIFWGFSRWFYLPRDGGLEVSPCTH